MQASSQHTLCLLQDAENNWQFDIFAFAEATPGNTLSLLVYHFYKTAGLMSHYHFDPAKFWCFLQKIEAGYDMNNPYHNR